VKDLKRYLGGSEEHTIEESEISVGDWSKDYELDKKWSETEMMILWQGIFHCELFQRELCYDMTVTQKNRLLPF
jgi:hypothetical protein